VQVRDDDGAHRRASLRIAPRRRLPFTAVDTGAIMSVAMSNPVEHRAIRILREPERDRVPESGAVASVQVADVAIPGHLLDPLWKPEYLERLARSYWRFLTRISLGLIRVVYAPDSRTVVVISPHLPLLRFHAPEYEADSEGGAVTWRIERGLLVAREGRGRGFLRIDVRRFPAGWHGLEPPPGDVLLRVRVEVRNFYPWIRGRGRFARFGTWLYSNTQLPIHVLVCRLFLRSLVRLDLPPSRVGALRGEIAVGEQPEVGGSEG
jgi:hypothetical protein